MRHKTVMDLRGEAMDTNLHPIREIAFGLLCGAGFMFLGLMIAGMLGAVAG